jgi:hypothetical protein
MTEVFMPINLRIEKIIVDNAHLIEGDTMPEAFGQMLAHVAAYKAIMKTWLENPPRDVNYDSAKNENTALLPFPQTFPEHVRYMFNELKIQQTRLIGIIGQTRSVETAPALMTSGSVPPSSSRLP